jgi:hypothetical protein
MRFSNRLARNWGGAASNFAVMALLTLVGGDLRAPAETHGIPTPDLRIAVSPVDSAGSRVLREIDDPTSGRRWLLMGDKTHSGGPGRLEPAPPGTDPGAAGRHTIAPRAGQISSMIRPGDKLVVEEHSPTTDAYLEGVALGLAGQGTALNVRLSIGGRVVRAVAVAPGRATLEAIKEAGR